MKSWFPKTQTTRGVLCFLTRLSPTTCGSSFKSPFWLPIKTSRRWGFLRVMLFTLWPALINIAKAVRPAFTPLGKERSPFSLSRDFRCSSHLNQNHTLSRATPSCVSHVSNLFLINIPQIHHPPVTVQSILPLACTTQDLPFSGWGIGGVLSSSLRSRSSRRRGRLEPTGPEGHQHVVGWHDCKCAHRCRTTRLQGQDNLSKDTDNPKATLYR